jgi:hypothetical protein
VTSPRLAAVVAAAVVVAALGGCASKAPATGVARVDRAVVLAYKPCGDAGKAGIGRIDIYGSADPERSVWTAVHLDDQPSTLDLPVVHRYPGYDINDRREGNHFDLEQTYSVEAVAIDGTAWGGPGFKVTDLRHGQIRVAGRYLPFTKWVDQPAECPNVTFLGALLTGLFVAAIAGGALLGARGIRRVVQRARRAPSPDA